MLEITNSELTQKKKPRGKGGKKKKKKEERELKAKTGNGDGFCTFFFFYPFGPFLRLPPGRKPRREKGGKREKGGRKRGVLPRGIALISIILNSYQTLVPHYPVGFAPSNRKDPQNKRIKRKERKRKGRGSENTAPVSGRSRPSIFFILGFFDWMKGAERWRRKKGRKRKEGGKGEGKKCTMVVVV